MRGAVRVEHVIGQGRLEGAFDLLDLITGLLIRKVQILHSDQENLFGWVRPDPAKQICRELDKATGLAELLVLLKEGKNILVTGMERVRPGDLIR